MAESPGTAARLRYIDIARALAILLMLEGHFVHLTLADSWRLSGHPMYELWLDARGVAAPMFYMVTGLIFSFLLAGAPSHEPFFHIRRVKRGMKRILELTFWGYLLQFQPSLITGEAGEPTRSWFIAFHVLQCIAIGLLIMMIVFFLLRRTRPWIVIIAFGALGFATFLLSIILANYRGYWPPSAPDIIQNIVQGPTSHFSIAPWLGFTFYGAAIGTFLRDRANRRHDTINPAGILIIGAILAYNGWPWDARIGSFMLDLLENHDPQRITPFFFHARFGESLIILAVAIGIDKWTRFNLSWLETIGRNTFPIYISHVIILYGGITGFGLNLLWEKSLNPWQAGVGAVVFCLAFAAYAQTVEPIQQWWKQRRQAG